MCSLALICHRGSLFRPCFTGRLRCKASRSAPIGMGQRPGHANHVLGEVGATVQCGALHLGVAAHNVVHGVANSECYSPGSKRATALSRWLRSTGMRRLFACCLTPARIPTATTPKAT